MSRLLIVDDDQDLCMVISNYLEDKFDEIYSAQSVPGAIGHVKSKKFSLIILDLNLVSGSGESVIKYARREDSINVKTPIVVISGELGFDTSIHSDTSFLSKPFDENKLLDKIRSLKKKDNSAASEQSATHPELLKLLNKG